MKFFLALLIFVVQIAIATEVPVKENIQPVDQEQIDELTEQLSSVQKELSKGSSIWMKSYNSYMAYQGARKSLRDIKNRIDFLQDNDISIENKLEIEALQAKQKVLLDQIQLLKGQGSSPFVSLLKPDEAGEIPKISNPFGILSGLSYIKRINTQYQDYQVREEELRNTIVLLKRQAELYAMLARINPQGDYEVELEASQLQYEKFKLALDTLVATAQVYEKRIESTEAKINKEIKEQIVKLLNLFVIIAVLLLLAFLAKRIIKRYIVDNERFYLVNKIVTFVNVTLIILILIFSYIDNVAYIATVLGFASAGLAVAMKDWFMSILGWLVIVIGGSIHVGDRIRFVKEGVEYVGDVLDISMQRITMMEDVTLTTVQTNRRAGRIVFVPNNYIFTSMLANYSHESLKTVWDGIDIVITFDSNHKKAAHIAKEICRKYSKGYTDITRKQVNKLRDKYSLKNSNVEPRIFTFIESNGIRVSSWYLTNAYATLTLRSTISADLVDAYIAEYDITIAYPTQTFYTGPIPPKELPPMERTHETKSLF